MDVTAEISTKNRYETLAHAIQSVGNQTVPPKKLIIWDDSDNPADIRKSSIFFNILKTFERKGIQWEVLMGPRVGQVFNHQSTIDAAQTKWIWRIDDDNIAEPDCLQKLLEVGESDPKIGGVAGCVLHPGVVFHPNATSGLIADSNFKYALQFAKFSGVREVEHFYSTFLFKKEAAVHGYCRELSRVGHREETIFSHEMYRAGWKLMVNGDAVTWHWQYPTGGIRTCSNPEFWQKDQQVFEKKIKQWGVTFNQYKFIYLNNGIGDHFDFRKILPEIKAKHKNIIVSACYPEAFFDEKDVEIIDLNSGQILSNGDVEKYDVYKFCFDRNWNKSLVEAFRQIYL